jgi:hypothetical protein
VAGTASALLGVIQFLVGAVSAPLVGAAGTDQCGADGGGDDRVASPRWWRAVGAGTACAAGPR